MDRLPIDLFKYIFKYVDQLPDLIRASLVCHYWRSHIIDDEHFLNEWFHRSLKHSQQSCRNNPITNYCHYEQGSTGSLDRFQFPQNLQSSKCHLLQVIDPFYIAGSQYFFEQQYEPSLFDGYYSLSFWFFLPTECELVVRIGMDYVLDLHNCSHGDNQSRLFEDKKTLFDDPWIHIVITNSESQTRYRVWFNGQDMNKFKLHRTFNTHTKRGPSTDAIMLTCKRNNYSMQPPVEACIADLVAFKRCLSMTEIRAIYQQQRGINQVQIGTYMKNKRQNRLPQHNQSCS